MSHTYKSTSSLSFCSSRVVSQGKLRSHGSLWEIQFWLIFMPLPSSVENEMFLLISVRSFWGLRLAAKSRGHERLRGSRRTTEDENEKALSRKPWLLGKLLFQWSDRGDTKMIKKSHEQGKKKIFKSTVNIYTNTAVTLMHPNPSIIVFKYVFGNLMRFKVLVVD